VRRVAADASSPSISAGERALVEDWAHLRLPPGAHDLRYHTERGADPAIWLRLTLPAGERAELLRSAGHEHVSSAVRHLRDASLAGHPWWQPDAVAPFESGALVRSASRPRYGSTVLLGPAADGEGELTVYLFVTGL
jgi:hypothetical protein